MSASRKLRLFGVGYVRNIFHTCIIFAHYPFIFFVMVRRSKRIVALDELGDVVVAHCIGKDAMALAYSESESSSGSDDEVELSSKVVAVM